MKAILCLCDPEEETILSHVLRFANVISAIRRDLPRVLNEWSDDPADLLLVAAKPQEAADAVVAIRTATDVPLIVIIDSLGEEGCIDLYRKGSDLVILRPYSHRLLKVQVEALLRRGMSLPLHTIPALKFADFTVQPTIRTLQRTDGMTVVLTHREFQLFYLLFTHRGQILTNEQIIETIWGHTGRGDKNMLRSLVNRLRRKIEPDIEDPRYLTTVSGVGYRFDDL